MLIMSGQMEILVCVLVLFSLYTDVKNTGGGSGWSYDGASGPSFWPSINHDCGGQRQSPVNIDKFFVTHDTTLTDLTFHNFQNTTGMDTAYIKNNGHTIQVDLPMSDMYVEGGGLSRTYKVVQFHFHWGQNDKTGSEHTINQLSYPMEVHFVTYAVKYGDILTALNYADGLAVLGFFFDVGPNNHTVMDIICGHVDKVMYKVGIILVRLMFRNLFRPIETRTSWYAKVQLDESVTMELWLDNIDHFKREDQFCPCNRNLERLANHDPWLPGTATVEHEEFDGRANDNYICEPPSISFDGRVNNNCIWEPPKISKVGIWEELSSFKQPELHHLVEKLQNVVLHAKADGTVKNDNRDKTFNLTTLFSLDSLLPAARSHYYRYLGSLTTPGCNEVVTWTVFKEPIKISSSQLQTFRNVFQSAENETTAMMYGNYRPVQPINHRIIYTSHGVRLTSHFTVLFILPCLLLFH